MKNLLLTASLILFATFGIAQTEDTAVDEKAINKIIEGINESFQKRDAKLRARLFTEDGIFINAFGVEKVGRAAIEQFWKGLFSTGTFDQTEIKVTGMKIRFLTPDIAVVDRFEQARGQRGTETKRILPPRTIHLTLIMKRSRDGWLMAYYTAADLRELATVK